MRFFVLLLAATAASAQVVPDMFLVEMADAPKGELRQASVRKQAVRAGIEQRGFAVTDSFDNILDAMVVRGTARKEDLEALPGVRKVYHVFERRLYMDRAPAIHRAVEAYRIPGGDKQGLGIKIGIIDTGVEFDHPAFQDDSLETPAGFPRGNRDGDSQATNKKVIVMRTYGAGQFDVPSTRDTVGHGTSTAMVAAGSRHQAPIGEVSGMAPKAFIGAYKIADASGRLRDDYILRAMEDAVNDGMDVLNLSFGITPELSPDSDPMIRATERAAARGVIVVQAAGNDGPEVGTIGSNSQTSAVINVGASANDRVLTSTVSASSGFIAQALPAATVAPGDPVRGDGADAASVDPSGLLCTAPPAGAFAGRVVLVFRGTCTFEEKLNHAQRAGAVAAVIYTNDVPAGAWDLGAAKLPGLMISNESGRLLKQQLAAGAFEVTLQFKSAPFPQNPSAISTFSSSGPTAGNTIGIDMVAVGQNVYTAAQRVDSRGQVFNSSGYISVNGTSYSSPMVAGAAAILKAARPGLDMIHYKSLLVNTATAFADGSTASVLRMGAGVLNVERALRATAAVSPVSVSFGAGAGTADLTRTFQLTNLSRTQDTFTVSVQAAGLLTAAPQVLTQTLTLQPGASAPVSLRWTSTGLTPGGYQGFVLVRGTASDIELRIPYWYAVTGSAPRFISTFRSGQTARAGQRATFYVRVGDAAGVAMMANAPVVQAVAGEGEVLSVAPSQLFPACWLVEVRLGSVPGENIFRIAAGEIGREFVLFSGA